MKFICLQKISEKLQYNSGSLFYLCRETSFHHNTGYIERFITMNTVTHPIPPVFDSSSRILILGSFPSVKSREGHFFYHHPQNRFWKTLAGILTVPVPGSIDEKKEFLLSHHIALWDVIASCSIEGSSDSSIRDVVPNDLSRILSAADIQAIFCNGKTSWNYYKKYQETVTGIPAVSLPSTSPANAAWTLEKLEGVWDVISDYLE